MGKHSCHHLTCFFEARGGCDFYYLYFSFHNLKDLSTKPHLYSHEIINPALSDTIVARSKNEMLWLGFGALLTAMGLILCLACEEDKRRVSFGP